MEQLIYVKGNKTLHLSTKFIYNSSIYKIWDKGACLLDEKYYACDVPLDTKKIQIELKKNNYIIKRFLELEGAPEEYLKSKGYKRKKV